MIKTILPVGAKVLVRKVNSGKPFIDYVTRESIEVTKCETFRDGMFGIEHKGYEIHFDRDQAVEIDDKPKPKPTFKPSERCQCKGSGISKTFAGVTYRTLCCAACPYRTKRE